MSGQFGLDLEAVNGDGTFRLPVPATFLIDQNRVIRYASADVDYTKRAESSDVIAALQSLPTLV